MTLLQLRFQLTNMLADAMQALAAHVATVPFLALRLALSLEQMRTHVDRISPLVDLAGRIIDATTSPDDKPVLLTTVRILAVVFELCASCAMKRAVVIQQVADRLGFTSASSSGLKAEASEVVGGRHRPPYGCRSFRFGRCPLWTAFFRSIRLRSFCPRSTRTSSKRSREASRRLVSERPRRHGWQAMALSISWTVDIEHEHANALAYRL